MPTKYICEAMRRQCRYKIVAHSNLARSFTGTCGSSLRTAASCSARGADIADVGGHCLHSGARDCASCARSRDAWIGGGAAFSRASCCGWRRSGCCSCCSCCCRCCGRRCNGTAALIAADGSWNMARAPNDANHIVFPRSHTRIQLVSFHLCYTWSL